MKKKIIIIIGITIIALLVTNIITYAFSNENLFKFFFANNDNQKKIAKKILTKGNQKIEIDNYSINLEESLCEKNTQLGYLVFLIYDKTGNRIDADINEYSKIINSFGKDKRFIFEYEASGTFNKYAKYVGNKLYVYVSFEINTEDSQEIDLNNRIKITDTEEKIHNEYKQYNFDLKFSDNCRKFKNNEGILYLSPLGLRFVTNNIMDNLNIIIHDEKDSIVKNLNTRDNMLSESGCNANGVTKVQYTNQFDDLLDINIIKNVYINEQKLEEVK